MTGFSGDPMAWLKLKAIRNSSQRQEAIQVAILQQLQYQSYVLYNIAKTLEDQTPPQEPPIS